MALTKEIKTENYTISIWQITENLEELKTMLNNAEITEKIEAKYSNTKRQSEQLVSHLIIKHLIGRAEEIKHRSNGAPYIQDKEKHISISHSRKSVAVAISNTPIGIDIEECSRKQYALYKRYTTPTEQEWIENTSNTTTQQQIAEIIWSAKEAIYKLANIEGLLFESEIEITPFTPTNETQFKATYRNTPCTCQLSVDGSELLVVTY